MPKCLESIIAAGGPHFIARHQRQRHGQATPPRQQHAPTLVSQIIDSPAYHDKHARQSSSAKVEKQPWSTPPSPVRPPPASSQVPIIPAFHHTPKTSKVPPQIIERPRSVSDAPIIRLPAPAVEPKGGNVPVQSFVQSMKSQSTDIAHRKGSAPAINYSQPVRHPPH